MHIAEVHSEIRSAKRAIANWVNFVEGANNNRRRAEQMRLNKLSRGFDFLFKNRNTSKLLNQIDRKTQQIMLKNSLTRGFRTLRENALVRKRIKHTANLAFNNFKRMMFFKFVSQAREAIMSKKLNNVAATSHRGALLRNVFNRWTVKAVMWAHKKQSIIVANAFFRRRELQRYVGRASRKNENEGLRGK